MKTYLLTSALLLGLIPSAKADILLDCTAEVTTNFPEKRKEALRVNINERHELTIEIAGNRLRAFFVAPLQPSVSGSRLGVFNGSDGSKWKIESEDIGPDYRVRKGITIDRRTGQLDYWSMRLDREFKTIFSDSATGTCDRAKNRF